MSTAELTLALRIAALEDLAEGIRGFTLVSADAGTPLPAFTPGAHLALRTPCGNVRSYSLCNAPTDALASGAYRIAVKREPASRGGSASLHDAARVGEVLAAGAPRNAFAFNPAAKACLFIAGGIGITPILSMIRALAATAEQGEYAPPWKLVLLGRDAASTPFLDELRAHGRRVTVHFDGGAAERRFDLWPLLEKPNSAEIWCCGPRPLMDSVRDMTGHWSTGKVHFESFVEGGVARPDDQPFRVRLARSGTEFAVPVGTSLLAALRAHGCAVGSSCESGTCGSCRTGLVAGVAEHRDMVLLPEEMDHQIMPCVSRAAGGLLELDL